MSELYHDAFGPRLAFHVRPGLPRGRWMCEGSGAIESGEPMGHQAALALARSANTYRTGPLYTERATPLVLADGSERRALKVESAHAIIRNEDETVTGVCGTSFTDLSDAETLASVFVDVGEDGQRSELKLDIFGALGKTGSEHFAQARIPDSVIQAPGGEDRIRHWLFARWGHDGRTALEFGGVDERVWCANTLAIATRELGNSGQRMRHTKNLATRARREGTKLALARQAAQARTEAYQALARKDLTRDQMASVARAVATGERAAASFTPEQARENMTRKAQESVDAMLALFDGAGDGAAVAGATAWGGYNAATQWLDRSWNQRKVETPIDRAIRVMDSAEANERRQLAYVTVSAFAGVV